MKKCKLEKLYEQATSYDTEAKRLEDLEKAKRIEEAKILKEGSLENQEIFDQVARIRMMREMIPSKIRQLEEQSVATWGEVKVEMGICKRIVDYDIQARINAEKQKLADLLLPCCESAKEALEVVEGIYENDSHLPKSLRLLRDEMGDLPCYTSETGTGAAYLIKKYVDLLRNHPEGSPPPSRSWSSNMLFAPAPKSEETPHEASEPPVTDSRKRMRLSKDEQTFE